MIIDVSNSSMIIIGGSFGVVAIAAAGTYAYTKIKQKKHTDALDGIKDIPDEKELLNILKSIEKPKTKRSGDHSLQTLNSVRMIANKVAPKKEIIPEIISEIESKTYDAIRHNKSKWSIKYWKSHLKDKWFPQKSVLINMELANGMNRHFLILLKPDNSFRYNKKMYLTDNESKYYVIDSKMWAYDFHEDFALPIKRKIPLIKIKKTLENSKISEIEYATNPSTLERFTIAKIAEGIMRGQQIDEFFKRIQLLMIITMAAAVIHLILFMIKSGMLQQIKIPGVMG